jgi:hypothetical protein
MNNPTNTNLGAASIADQVAPLLAILSARDGNTQSVDQEVVSKGDVKPKQVAYETAEKILKEFLCAVSAEEKRDAEARKNAGREPQDSNTNDSVPADASSPDTGHHTTDEIPQEMRSIGVFTYTFRAREWAIAHTAMVDKMQEILLMTKRDADRYLKVLIRITAKLWGTETPSPWWPAFLRTAVRSTAME